MNWFEAIKKQLGAIFPDDIKADYSEADVQNKLEAMAASKPAAPKEEEKEVIEESVEVVEATIVEATKDVVKEVEVQEEAVAMSEIFQSGITTQMDAMNATIASLSEVVQALTEDNKTLSAALKQSEEQIELLRSEFARELSDIKALGTSTTGATTAVSVVTKKGEKEDTHTTIRASWMDDYFKGRANAIARGRATNN